MKNWHRDMLLLILTCSLFAFIGWIGYSAFGLLKAIHDFSNSPEYKWYWLWIMLVPTGICVALYSWGISYSIGMLKLMWYKKPAST